MGAACGTCRQPRNEHVKCRWRDATIPKSSLEVGAVPGGHRECHQRCAAIAANRARSGPSTRRTQPQLEGGALRWVGAIVANQARPKFHSLQEYSRGQMHDA